ncbi:MAG: hypothetical protein ACYDC8_17800, partial [Gammaproteobacteria bacterium]
MNELFSKHQQTRISTSRRRVDRQRAFGDEAQQVVRAAGFGAGAGESFAADAKILSITRPNVRPA